jgi:CRP-like cAMP-binding protein
MPPKPEAEILKSSLIFSGLKDDELGELAGIARMRVIQAGQTVFWEGDSPEWFYLIAVGRVKVVKHSSTGKDFIIAFFGPGDMFGEVAVFENRPYPASAEAATDSEVLGIKRDSLLAFLARHPEVSLKIIDVLGARLRKAQGRLRDLAGERVEQRVARILLMLSSRLGGTLPFTRQEIADMSGTTLETTIRIMSRLKEGGIIRSNRGKTVILDETRLRLLSEGPPAL